MLKFAIIGFGGLGKLHFGNTFELERKRGDIKLTAICDVETSRFTEKVTTNLGDTSTETDLSGYNLYTDVNEMLEKEQLDFVITALPTYLHSEIAILALEKGLHVFSEKPMARNPEQCQSMVEKAQENKKLLMIGQCLRYWPEYQKLKEYIDSGEFGNVVRAEFFRYSGTPKWSWQNWLLDFNKSGGATVDMHVHDVDFINWAFGKPEAVTSNATHSKTEFESISSTYKYSDKLVTACCDWSFHDTYPFSHSFLVRFERATVEMDANGMKVYTDDKEGFTPDLKTGSAYMNEMNDFIDCIKEGRELTVITPESAQVAVKIVFAEMESSKTGMTVNI